MDAYFPVKASLSIHTPAQHELFIYIYHSAKP